MSDEQQEAGTPGDAAQGAADAAQGTADAANAAEGERTEGQSAPGEEPADAPESD